MVVGNKVICNKLNFSICIIIEITNYSFYKLPNIKVLDRNNNLVIVTDFDLIK